jgi:hypothetical protein
MFKTATVSTAVALLALVNVCLAQPPGVTPEMIARALPLEGAPLAEPGPYEIKSEPAFGAPGLLLFRPTNLDAFPTRDTLPVLVWGNGGCSLNTARYSGFLTTITSHGFIALGTAPQNEPQGTRATADKLRAAIDWAEAENERAGSPLNGKIATDKVAVMGQSCGGFMSITLGADPRVDTIGVFNSGIQRPEPGAQPAPGRSPDALAALHGPVLIIDGHEPDFMWEAAQATFEMVNGLPTFYGSRHNAGHTATVFHPGGGEYANVVSNWLKWTFKSDKKAATMFVGKDCSLCTNPNWDTKSKGLKE